VTFLVVYTIIALLFWALFAHTLRKVDDGTIPRPATWYDNSRTVWSWAAFVAAVLWPVTLVIAIVKAFGR
jgi:hypothetical protein